MKKHWRVNLKRLDKYVVDFAIDKGDFWEIDGLNSVVAIGKGRLHGTGSVLRGHATQCRNPLATA